MDIFFEIKGGKWGAIDTQGNEVISVTEKDEDKVADILEKKLGWTNRLPR